MLASVFLRFRYFVYICLIVLNSIVTTRAFCDMREGSLNVRAKSGGRRYDVCFIVILHIFFNLGSGGLHSL